MRTTAGTQLDGGLGATVTIYCRNVLRLARGKNTFFRVVAARTERASHATGRSHWDIVAESFVKQHVEALKKKRTALAAALQKSGGSRRPLADVFCVLSNATLLTEGACLSYNHLHGD